MDENFPPQKGPPGEMGNYQHNNWWRNADGDIQFGISAWVNSDGSVTIVPESMRAPGALPGRVEGSTIVKGGTIHEFRLNQGGFVDTGKPATPEMVTGGDGKLQSAGYNPGTGKWMVAGPDGTPVNGSSPDNAAQIPAALAQVKAGLSRLEGLIG